MGNSVNAMIDELIGREGGYSNHPSDRGGATRWGVTEQVARAYGYKGDMRELPREKAFDIYLHRYYVDVRFDQVAAVFPRVGAELFDTGVNMGQEIAARFLQRALNLLNRQASAWPDIKVDGNIGQMTIQAARSLRAARGARGETVLLKALDGFQTCRYAEITEARPANEDFFFGWLDNRIGQA